MKTTLGLAMLATVAIAMPLSAQHEARRPAMAIPQSPPRRDRPDAEPRAETPPHVYDGRWFGHASPNDERFRLDRPFEHGIFARTGPSHHFAAIRFDRDAHRFWLAGGFGFEVAAWEWDFTADWCWSCGDDFVVYDDLDHAGWYILYDIPTGQYVHVRYLGS